MLRLALLLALTLLTTPVHAQRTQDAAGEGRGGLEMQLTSGAAYEAERLGGHIPTVHAPFVTLQVRLTQQITRLAPDTVLELDLDAAVGGSGFYVGWAGSPWLGLGLASRTEEQTARVVLGVAPPVASIQASSGRFEDVLTGGWNGWNEWLGARPVVPFGLQAMAEWRFTELDVGADLALIGGPTFSAEGAPLTDAAYFAWAAIGAWLTGHLSGDIDLGARLQAVGRFMQTNASASGAAAGTFRVHASLTPYLRILTSQARSPSPWPSFLEFRLNFNFVEPYGPVFLANNFHWSLALATGTHW